MPERPPEASPTAGRFLTAATWFLAAGAVAATVAWHDPYVRGYWDERVAGNGLFLNLMYDRSGLSLALRRARAAGEPPPAGAEWVRTWVGVMRFESDFSVGLLAASAGLLLVDCRRRLRHGRVWREPGSVACAAAVAAMALCLLEEASVASQANQGFWRSPSNPFPNAWPNYELRIGLAVLGAWSVMALAGRWRPRPSAADRAGVLVGWLWLVALLYRTIASSVIPFANWGY